jgi:hypothetical protein
MVLLDLGLPGQDGQQMRHRLRGAGKTMPLLIITARDDLDERLRGLDGGADDYIVKPFAMALNRLLGRLAAALAIERRFIGDAAAGGPAPGYRSRNGLVGATVVPGTRAPSPVAGHRTDIRPRGVAARARRQPGRTSPVQAGPGRYPGPFILNRPRTNRNPVSVARSPVSRP